MRTDVIMIFKISQSCFKVCLNTKMLTFIWLKLYQTFLCNIQSTTPPSLRHIQVSFSGSSCTLGEGKRPSQKFLWQHLLVYTYAQIWRHYSWIWVVLKVALVDIFWSQNFLSRSFLDTQSVRSDKGSLWYILLTAKILPDLQLKTVPWWAVDRVWI